jgi:hypothetical protein
MRLGTDKRVRVNILMLKTIIRYILESLGKRLTISFLGDFLGVS